MVRDFLLRSRMSRRRSSIDDAVVHHYSWGNLTNKGGLAHAFRFLVTTTSEGAPSFPAFGKGGNQPEEVQVRGAHLSNIISSSLPSIVHPRDLPPSCVPSPNPHQPTQRA